MSVRRRSAPDPDKDSVGLVLAGGVGLGAYQGGAFAALSEDLHGSLDWIAGSSIGAVNAVIIAGNPPDDRAERLRQFWTGSALPGTAAPKLSGALGEDVSRTNGWMSASAARLFGVPNLFRPNLWGTEAAKRSLYSLDPLETSLMDLVDFDRLNAGQIRVSLATTDLETGELVVFDTAKGHMIGPEHVRASCGFAPDFPPVLIDGRLLGDGGYAANAPVDVMLAEERRDENERICFVLDLFASDGVAPSNWDQSASRRRDLLLGSPTARVLSVWQRERKRLETLQRQLGLDEEQSATRKGRTTILHLSYRAHPGRALAEKEFDFGADAIAERWQAGQADMLEAVETLRNRSPSDEDAVHRIRVREATSI